MRLSLVIIFTLFIIKSVVSGTRLSVCELAGGADRCMLACNLQNCATGSCNSNNACECSRCDNLIIIGAIIGIGKRETFKKDSIVEVPVIQ
jgi:hypothetical protein